MQKQIWIGMSCVLAALIILVVFDRSLGGAHRETTELAGWIALGLSDLPDDTDAKSAIDRLKRIGVKRYEIGVDSEDAYSASLWPDSWWNVEDSRVSVALVFAKRRLVRFNLKVLTRSL